jgi:hypothetical protein
MFKHNDEYSSDEIHLTVGKCYKDNYDVIWEVMFRQTTTKNDYNYVVKDINSDQLSKVLSNGSFGDNDRDVWYNSKHQIVPVAIDNVTETKKDVCDMFDVYCYYGDNLGNVFLCVSYENQSTYKFHPVNLGGSVTAVVYSVRVDGSFCNGRGREMLPHKLKLIK